MIEEAEGGEEADVPVRCRRAEKGSAGWAERQHRRTQRKLVAKLEAGVEIGMPLSLDERYRRAAEREKEVRRHQSFHLKLRSASTGQGFSLVLRRAQGHGAIVVDVYGLAAQGGVA